MQPCITAVLLFISVVIASPTSLSSPPGLNSTLTGSNNLHRRMNDINNNQLPSNPNPQNTGLNPLWSFRTNYYGTETKYSVQTIHRVRQAIAQHVGGISGLGIPVQMTTYSRNNQWEFPIYGDEGQFPDFLIHVYSSRAFEKPLRWIDVSEGLQFLEENLPSRVPGVGVPLPRIFHANIVDISWRGGEGEADTLAAYMRIKTG